ncbi:hypothetical protein JH300_20035 [Xanthomonas campestris pv. campestris]|uniref:hypothetical protein n=1 Tax=Xanthomonas campestris TaxID=339 RepID=UPI0023782E25|nr:hypothetical protein [Xanthomonas campestris]WDK35504.1 hypothetical protein JH300_20035 [Xanthomonas campestris pv. campestris]
MQSKLSQWWLSFRKARAVNLWADVVPTLLFGLALASLFALGPLVQAIVVALFSGETSSLYDSENVGQIVNINAYLKTVFWPPYLAGGLLSAVAMRLAPTKRTVFASGTVAIGLSLTAIDLSSGALDGLAVSILCNFAAGAVLANLTLVLVLDNQIVRRVANGNTKVEQIVWLLAPAIGCFALATILFCALGFLTTVPTTPASFRLEPDLNGYYVTEDGQKCGADDKGKSKQCGSGDGNTHSKFSLLGNYREAEGGRTEFLGGGAGLKIGWSKTIKGPIKGSLWVTQGCVGENASYKDALKATPLYAGEIRDLVITADEGLSDFRVIDPKLNEITVSDDHIAQFWINPSPDDPEKIDVSRFLSNGTIQVADKFTKTTFVLGLIPLTGNEEGPAFKARSATYSINGDDARVINFRMAEDMIEVGASMSCEALSVSEQGKQMLATSQVPYVNLVVSLETPERLSLEEVGKPSHVTVSGANGWIKSTGFRKDKFHEAISGGGISQLSVIGVVRDLVVDGQVISTGATSTLQLSGKMYARADGPGVLIEGGTDYLIINGKRVSSTRWERLDAGVRVPIILGVPTAAYFVLTFAGSTLRRPVRLVWRRPERRRRLTSRSRPPGGSDR